MKSFNRTLSLSIDALHVRIDYVKAMAATEAAKRRLRQLRGQLRKLERKIKA